MEQHFLTDPAKLAALVRAADIRPDSRVLELGAGGGTVAAALPPCQLTLVELDATLASRLRKRFPNAVVLQEDANSALERLEFDIVLSNLPHTLTGAVLARLFLKRFRRALIAVHEADVLDAPGHWTLEPLLTLDETDFSPPQPFKSKLILVRPRLNT